LLVLDEPTSSLDARTEHELFQQVQALANNRPVVLISHRFGAVRMAERIIVMERGMVVEDGDHQQLLAQGCLYAKLFNMQAEKYRL
jgi:ATP-binding cassette, subfamily B, bacterial